MVARQHLYVHALGQSCNRVTDGSVGYSGKTPLQVQCRQRHASSADAMQAALQARTQKSAAR